MAEKEKGLFSRVEFEKGATVRSGLTVLDLAAKEKYSSALYKD